MLALFSLSIVSMSILMALYICQNKRPELGWGRITMKYYAVFTLLFCWHVTLIIYFMQTFYNYNWKELHLTSSLPLISTYLIVGICIYNM